MVRQLQPLQLCIKEYFLIVLKFTNPSKFWNWIFQMYILCLEAVEIGERKLQQAYIFFLFKSVGV